LKRNELETGVHLDGMTPRKKTKVMGNQGTPCGWFISCALGLVSISLAKKQMIFDGSDSHPMIKEASVLLDAGIFRASVLRRSAIQSVLVNVRKRI
jgi:hypothetical protein